MSSEFFYFSNEMIHNQDILTIELQDYQIRTCKIYAERLLLARQMGGVAAGGVSRVRNQKDRQQRLHEDCLTGQLGNCAGSLVLTGSIRGYLQAREIADGNPTKGDSGSDLPGLPIDFKSTRIRNRNIPLLDYSLKVRPHERHRNNIYVLCLVDMWMVTKVHLVGWCEEKEIPHQVETSGAFKGAFSVNSSILRPIRFLDLSSFLN